MRKDGGLESPQSVFFLLYPISPPHLQFKCCGSNNSSDWLFSAYMALPDAEGRVVPDSCCKTVTPHCGRRDHPSNIYKVEVGLRSLGGGGGVD